MLAQSLEHTIKSNPDLELEMFLFLNPQQAAVDAEVIDIDVAVVDMTVDTSEETNSILSFCEAKRNESADCHLMLMVSQNDKAGREKAIDAMKRRAIDDFVFYDTSLDYLLAKLIAF